MKSRIIRAFRHKPSETKSPNYARLLGSIRTSDHALFRKTLSDFVREIGEIEPTTDLELAVSQSKGEITLIEGLGVMASQSEQAVGWLADMICSQDEVFRRVAFHALRRVGTGAMPVLRKVWDREHSQLVRGRLHMCMMDIIQGARNSVEQMHEMPLLAEREIPRWIETLRTAEPRVRGWAVMTLVALVQYAPVHAEEIRNQLSDFSRFEFPTNDDLARRDLEAMRDFAARALKDLL